MPDFGRNSGGDPSLNEINRTDQFLDALASQQPVYATDRGEAELAHLLAGWRDDVRETPMGHVLTAEDAEIALGRVTKPPRRRLSLAVIGSAAAAVLAIGGVGAVVAGSGPGDALYGLRTMLFGEQTQTRDDAVILAAQTEMQQVQQLIEQGDWAGAQAKLEAVTTTVATVNDVAQKEELIAQWQELTVKVEAQDPVATVPPGAPLPTFPDVPVAVLDPGTSPSSETTSATPSSETTSPAPSSETTSPTSPSETTSATPSSETTSPAPSSETTSPAPSETTTPSSATSAPTSTPSPTPSTPSTTTSVGAAPPPSTTPTSTTAPTSTTVVNQSATTTRAPLSTSGSAAAPPTPTPTPTPTAVPTVDEETVPSPTAPALPTTTTPIILLPVPGEAG